MKTAQKRLEETKESPGLRVGPNLAQAPGISNPEPKEEAIETLEVEKAEEPAVE